MLEFPAEYPQRPPKMRFTSEILHPNSEFFFINYKYK